MGAESIGNIHVALYVDTNQTSRFSAAANIIDRDSQRMRSALAGTDRSLTSLRSSMNQNLRIRLASDSLRTLSGATTEINRLRAAMLGVAAVTGTGITGAFGGAFLLQTADKARLLSNQLKTVTTDSTDLAAVQEKLYQVAQRTRSGLDSTVTLYARTARATENFGLSQQKLLDITETVQKAFAIGGASPEEASGAAIQLSQGIASNRFSGDEFRSVAENAPVLLRAMAESLTKGSIGDLRKMAFEGKLTADTVVKAILDGKKRIDAEFAKTTPTLGQSLIQVENSFVRYIGDTDNAYGVTQTLAKGLKNVSDNFEEVMYWVTRVGGGLAAVFGARAVGSSASSFIGRVQGNSAAIRDEIKDLQAEAQEIAARRAEIGKQMAEVAAQSRGGDSKIAADRAAKLHALSEKEYNAQQGVASIEKQRADLSNKIAISRNDAVQRAQREVELARQTVRDDALRVAQAQEAALAEERNLRARQQQKVVAASEVVGSRQVAVGAANGRVANAQAAIRAEQELARTKITGEIQARRESIVTNSMRLSSTQKQIADLRSIQDLEGFDDTYGGQYRKLLSDQQKFITATQKARDEIGGLEGKLQDLDNGEAITRGLTTAMTKHAAAVKNAEAAVASLQKAEAARDAIGAAPVGGKSLDARLKAEADQLARYEKSVGNLQDKMQALAAASTGAFDTKATQKMVAQIGELDKKLTLARANLANASRAVAEANGNDLQSVGAAMALREQSLREYQALETEAAMLVGRTTENIEKQAASQKKLNLLRRAGSSIGNGILDFFGGPVGLGITAILVAASVGMSAYYANAQKAAERTERLKKEMVDLGIATDDTADSVDGAGKSLNALKFDQLKVKLADIADEIARLQTKQGFFDALFNYDPKNLGNIQTQLQFIAGGGIDNRFGDVEQNAAKALNDLIEQAKAGRTPAAELFSKLDQLGKQNLSTGMLRLIDSTRDQIRYMDQLGQLGKDYADQLSKAATDMEKGARVGKQTLDEQFNDIESQRGENLRRRMYPDELGSTAEQAMQAAAKGMHDLIGFFEGTDKGRGYNETLDFGKWTGDVELTSMTLRQILALQAKMLANPENRAQYGGIGSSAVGRYQIVSKTLKDQIDKLGLSLDDYFTPELQDRIADNLIRQRGRNPAGLQQEWAGLQKAPDYLITKAFDAMNLPPVDASWQKWVDGLKDLDLQKKLVGLDDFNQRVVQQAQSMGASADEVKKYVDAVSSGQLDQIPDRFKKIIDGLQGITDNSVLRQLKEMDLTNTISMLTEVEQKTIETARQFGIAEPVIRAYIAALMSGEQIPPVMQAIQDASQRALNVERYNQFAGDVANTLGHAFDGAIGGTESWSDALKNLGLQLGDLVYQLLVVEPLIRAIKAAMESSGASDWLMSALGLSGGGSVGGSGSSSGMDPFQDVFSLAGGGDVRGPGTTTSDSIPAMLSNEEFVVNAKQAKKHRKLLDAINSGKILHFASGGPVGNYTPPSMVPSDGGRWGGPTDVTFKIDVSNAQGDRDLEERTMAAVKKGIDAYDRQMPVRLGPHLQKAKTIGSVK